MLPSGGDFCGDIAQELQEDRDERGEGCISGDDGMKLAVQGDRADRRRGRVAARSRAKLRRGETVLAVPRVRVEARWIFGSPATSIEIQVTGVAGIAGHRRHPDACTG